MFSDLFCSKVVTFSKTFSNTFPGQKKIEFQIILVLDVAEGVKLLGVFVGLCALIRLTANIFQL